MMVMK